MPVAKLNAQRLIDLAEKKIAEHLVDDLIAWSTQLPDIAFPSQAHATIAKHRERLGLIVTALEASK